MSCGRAGLHCYSSLSAIKILEHLVAMKRLYLLGENDQPTGTFTFADLLSGELARAE
jgi:hypothetical protein